MFSLGKSKPRKILKFCPGNSEHFLLEGGVLFLFHTFRFSVCHTWGHLVTSSKVTGRGRPRHPQGGAQACALLPKELKEIGQQGGKKWNCCSF